jgi:hypothetical protein
MWRSLRESAPAVIATGRARACAAASRTLHPIRGGCTPPAAAGGGPGGWRVAGRGATAPPELSEFELNLAAATPARHAARRHCHAVRSVLCQLCARRRRHISNPGCPQGATSHKPQAPSPKPPPGRPPSFPFFSTLVLMPVLVLGAWCLVPRAASREPRVTWSSGQNASPQPQPPAPSSQQLEATVATSMA